MSRVAPQMLRTIECSSTPLAIERTVARAYDAIARLHTHPPSSTVYGGTSVHPPPKSTRTGALATTSIAPFSPRSEVAHAVNTCEVPQVVHIVVAHARGGRSSPKLSHAMTSASPTLGQSGTSPAPQAVMPDIARSFANRTLILLSNREPYEHRHGEIGIDVRRPPGGLVTALDPTMQATDGVWVAWGSGSADAETADHEGRLRVPPGEDGYTLRRVFLSDAEVDGYYMGFSNRSLWPLCHMLVQHFEYRTDYWNIYQEVNSKFAHAVADEVRRSPEKPIVWIQDYHFALAAEMLRELATPALIHQFWHIPFPPADILRLLPTGVDEALLRGLLGNDLIEFHTERYALNFLGCVAELVPEAEIDADTLSIHYDGRRIDVAIFPISIDVERYEQLASTPESDALVERLRKRYTSNGQRLGLGVDRVDYTKGIPERLRALCELWERHPEMRETFTFLLVATPSRSELPAYRALEEEMLADGHRDQRAVQDADVASRSCSCTRT